VVIGKKIFYLSFLLFYNAQLFAFTVTDPVSYTYYVQQIKKFTAQIDEAKKQVASLDVLKSTVASMNKTLKGNYNNAVGVVKSLKSLKTSVTDMAGGLKHDLEKAKKLGKDFNGYTSALALLDRNFGDPRLKDNRYAGKNLIYNVRQNALKNAIANAERVMQLMPERLEVIEQLAGKIDRTVNLKDSNDLQNRILVEMLKSNYELLILMSQLVGSELLMKYSGVTDKGALLKSSIKTEKKNILSSMSKVDRAIKEMGIDLNSETYSEDLINWADNQLGI